MSKKALDIKMNKILAKEDAGLLKTTNKSRALKKILANRLAVAGIVIFCIIIFMCTFPQLFTDYTPTEMDIRQMREGPSDTHLFGTDQVGRDVWSRMLYGGRVSIIIGLGGALGATFIGVSLGTYCGYKRGRLDAFIMKLSEVIMSFPQIILVSILVAIVGKSMMNIIFVFVFTGWTTMFRMTRSQMLSIRENEYVQALQAFGISDARVAFKHMLPNAIGPIVVNVTLATANFILQEAALSFLGLGVDLETATWGNILNPAQNLELMRECWWIWLPVGVMITLFVLAINFIGDGFRDAADPNQVG